MLLFCVDQVAQSFGGIEVFCNVSFQVQVGEKVALVGPNGVGKSSLLRIIAGMDGPAGGCVKFLTPTMCSLVSQHLDDNGVDTVRDKLEDAVLTGHRSVGEALKKFSFTHHENRPVHQLSGGEKTRLQLARVWLSGAGLFLLDEPSNHLDADGVDWLEQFVKESSDTILLVSHDRYFMDRTVQRVLELAPHGITSYPGGYTDYMQAKQAKQGQDERMFRDQEKHARKLQAAIEEQKSWAGQAHDRAAQKARELGLKSGKVHYRAKAKKMDHRVKNTIRRLERLEQERIARPKSVSGIDLSFTSVKRASKAILLADGIAKAYGTKNLFTNSGFSLKPGEKIGLVGKNGTGKTTLLRMIAGLEPLDDGSLWMSPSLRLGYLDQELLSLDQERTVLDEVATVCPDLGRVRDLLAHLLLTGEAVHKPCAVLSMGERVRAALAKLLLGVFDLLLLDEPANYLDLPSRKKLAEALMAYGGSLLIVSHDRYLLEYIADTVWAIEDSQVKVYPGPWSEYIQKCQTNEPGVSWPVTDRLELEFKKSRLLTELSMLDRTRQETEYLRLEKEYLETVRLLGK